MKTTMFKKMSKLVLVSALVASIALPGMVFADQSQVSPQAPAAEKVILNEKEAPNQMLTLKEKAPKVEKAAKVDRAQQIALKFAERLKAFEQKQQERLAQAEEKKANYRAKMTEVIAMFAADLMPSFESAWASHDAVHVDLMAERTRIKTSKLSKNQAYLLDIFAQVEAGTMTKEVAKTTIEAFRATNAADREVIKQTIEVMKSNSGVTPELRKELHEALTAAVASKDPVAVKAALNGILEALAKHIQFDVAKLAYLKTIQ